MKSIIAAGLVAGGLIVAPAAAATVTKVCLINGTQVVPPRDTPASGCGRFVIDTDANTVTYRIAFGGLIGSETVAHIHGVAAPGSNAGVKHALPLGNPKTGVWNYAEADEADILGGNMYVNIHSSVFTAGEIRGQIVDFVATIDGAQEVPPSGSAGGGWGLFNIDTCANELDYYIVVDDLDGTEQAAHIHGSALHGSNAGVLFSLGTGSPKVGTWTYPPLVEADLIAGRTYVNIHSDLFPSGEIRGQVTGIVAPLDGLQEVPGVSTAAYGCGFCAIDESADQFSYHLRHANLSSPQTLAHIHGFAPAGSNAGVQFNIGIGTPKFGVWSYSAGDEASVLGGLTYFNVHSQNFPGGEIRGQVQFPRVLSCPADIDCSGFVDFNDLLTVLSSWGPCPGCASDIDGDGIVGFNDLLTVLSSWGPCL